MSSFGAIPLPLPEQKVASPSLAPATAIEEKDHIDSKRTRAKPHPGRAATLVSNGINRSIPFLVLALSGYATYVYCYLYCWKEVVMHDSRRTGIAFIVVSSLLAGMVGVTWSQILILGPGRIARTPQIDLVTQPATIQTSDAQDALPGNENKRLGVQTDELPKMFACSPYGYPLWCSTCQSTKPDRVHHSAELNRCVPKMDHLCNWIGGVIGLRNYKMFVQFVFYMLVLLLFMVISLAVFAHDYKINNQSRTGPHHSIAHLIVVFALAGFWVVMLCGFLGVHLRYVFDNMTTIEYMKIKNREFLIFNFEASDKLRVVSRMRSNDPWPYSAGSLYANWKSVMGPSPLYWLLPIPVKYETSVQFNPKLLDILNQRYLEGKEGYLAYPHLQNIPEAHPYHFYQHQQHQSLYVTKSHSDSCARSTSSP